MSAKSTNRTTGTIGKVIWILIAVLLLSYFSSMAIGLYAVFFVPQSVQGASERVVSLPLSVFMVVNFDLPLGGFTTSLGGLLLAMWLLYAGAFTLAWIDRPSFASSPKNGHLDIAHSNYLALLPQLAAVVLVLVILLESLQESAGISSGGLPAEAPVVQFVSLSYAPFIEELSYRITTIGFIGGLFLLFKASRSRSGGKQPSKIRILLLSMWKPQAAKELLGLPTIQTDGVVRGLLRSEWVLLIISSVAFGAAHYLAGGGWDIGKISTAALSGFAIGLVYLRYGAYAPILLHWFFDYYFGAFDLASQLNLAGLGSLSVGINILNIGAGALFILVFVAFALKRTWTTWGLGSAATRQASSIGGFPNASLGDLRSPVNAALAAAEWPKCRTCGVPMTPADGEKHYWYCHRDSLWFVAKQNMWVAEHERGGKRLEQTTATDFEARTKGANVEAFCRNCGEAVPSDASFCLACGTNLRHGNS